MSARGALAAIILAATVAAAPKLALGGDGELRRALAASPHPHRTLDFRFRDADVKDVLRVLADAGGLDLVVGEGVTGRVSVHLTHARWIDAIEAVLASRQLGAHLDGRILFVDHLERLADRDRAQREREERQLALAPTVTRTIPLSYAEAARLAPLVQARLSPRGSVRVDARTNALIVTDVAPRLQAAVQPLRGR